MADSSFQSFKAFVPGGVSLCSSIPMMPMAWEEGLLQGVGNTSTWILCSCNATTFGCLVLSGLRIGVPVFKMPQS